MSSDITKDELEDMGFRSLNEDNCECDCMKGTCTDCFVRGYMKPWCSNCRTDINNGKCNCNDQKPYINKGWKDNTDRIIKHTKDEKKIIYEKIKKHNQFLKDATNTYNNSWMGKNCIDCGKSFKVKAKYDYNTCPTCTVKVISDKKLFVDENV